MPFQENPALIHELQMAMAHSIARRSGGMEDCPTPIPNFTLFRREAVTDPFVCLVEPCVGLVVQGAKRMLIGEESYAYDTEHFLITSLDFPARAQIVEASQTTPFLGLTMKLDLQIIAELIAQRGLHLPRDRSTDRSLGLGRVTSLLLEPFKRMLDLLDEPESIEVLAPLIQREIHYRLLMSDQAERVQQIASVGSQAYLASKAVNWLTENYSLPLHMEELAAQASMSASNLRRNFHQLTSMSPLQYQKWMRLHEAKRLMLNEHLDAASAAFRVGYESPSQFSREYSRLFGAPPKRDIEALRQRSDGLAQTRNSSSV